MNLVPVGCPNHGLRALDLDGPEEMCGECRVLGPDGKPLGWEDGRPTELTASQPWTVELCWTPDQNHGYVSTLNGRVPVASIVGLIRVGEPINVVADEYGLTVEQVSVIARLAEEGWAS